MGSPGDRSCFEHLWQRRRRPRCSPAPPPAAGPAAQGFSTPAKSDAPLLGCKLKASLCKPTEQKKVRNLRSSARARVRAWPNPLPGPGPAPWSRCLAPSRGSERPCSFPRVVELLKYLLWKALPCPEPRSQGRPWLLAAGTEEGSCSEAAPGADSRENAAPGLAPCSRLLLGAAGPSLGWDWDGEIAAGP